MLQQWLYSNFVISNDLDRSSQKFYCNFVVHIPSWLDLRISCHLVLPSRSNEGPPRSLSIHQKLNSVNFRLSALRSRYGQFRYCLMLTSTQMPGERGVTSGPPLFSGGSQNVFRFPEQLQFSHGSHGPAALKPHSMPDYRCYQ